MWTWTAPTLMRPLMTTLTMTFLANQKADDTEQMPETVCVVLLLENIDSFPYQ